MNLPSDFTDAIKPGQSLELLKELHILTRDGKINQDSRRKLKQVYHLYQFIEPLLTNGTVLVDHGAGKSYLGFIIFDLFFKNKNSGKIIGIETREDLVKKSKELATKLNFSGMEFHHLTVEAATTSEVLPEKVDMVTALHACDTATDDAIDFAFKKQAKNIVIVPCCQAEVASVLRKNKNQTKSLALSELWRHPLHTREFGSQITNVLRCLQLEAHGYKVTVTELVGWEHSMKNELIIATRHPDVAKKSAGEKLDTILAELNLSELKNRFYVTD